MPIIIFNTPKSTRKSVPSPIGNSRAEYYLSLQSLNKMMKTLEPVP